MQPEEKSTARRLVRYGAYGVVTRGADILLTLKNLGPYKGLWGLPGGGIEFGETPEETLRRELLEETTLAAGKLELLSIETSLICYRDGEQLVDFYHVGVIYKVLQATPVADVLPEEQERWAAIGSIDLEELTPFARAVISKLSPVNRSESGVWRPVDKIRAKSVGIAKWQDRLLVCEVRDDEGELKGWSLPGGGIELGETAEQALRREIFEELGSTIQIERAPLVYENLFEHHGAKGHEIVFAFLIQLDDREIYSKNRFQICETEGSLHWLEWVEMEQFRTGQATLFPAALLQQID